MFLVHKVGPCKSGILYRYCFLCTSNSVSQCYKSVSLSLVFPFNLASVWSLLWYERLIIRNKFNMLLLPVWQASHHKIAVKRVLNKDNTPIFIFYAAFLISASSGANTSAIVPHSKSFNNCSSLDSMRDKFW